MGLKSKIFENVRIETVAAEGKCVARIDGMAVFVQYTAPGDLVDLKIIRKKQKVNKVLLINFQEISDQEIIGDMIISGDNLDRTIYTE